MRESIPAEHVSAPPSTASARFQQHAEWHPREQQCVTPAQNVAEAAPTINDSTSFSNVNASWHHPDRPLLTPCNKVVTGAAISANNEMWRREKLLYPESANAIPSRATAQLTNYLHSLNLTRHQSHFFTTDQEPKNFISVRNNSHLLSLAKSWCHRVLMLKHRPRPRPFRDIKI